MSKKLIIQLTIFGALVLYTLFAWVDLKNDRIAAEKAAEETEMEDDYITGITQEKDDTTDSIVKVGAPLMITMIYGGILVVIYVLPMFVDRMGEELMGSTAEVDADPLAEVKEAVAEEDYPEAIRLYREIWKADPSQRFPMVEVARLQREKLESPAVAVMTLREALEGHDWKEDDAAFLMFRMAEIYEEDLEDKAGQVEILKKAVEDLPGSRHAANASHKLRELGSI